MKYIVDIKGEIEGDYEIISKYVEPKYILKAKNLTVEDKKRFQEEWEKSAGGLIAIRNDYDIIPIRQQGEWIKHEDRDYCRYGCNICGSLVNIKSNFCPNCGADMRGAE